MKPTIQYCPRCRKAHEPGAHDARTFVKAIPKELRNTVEQAGADVIERAIAKPVSPKRASAKGVKPKGAARIGRKPAATSRSPAETVQPPAKKPSGDLNEKSLEEALVQIRKNTDDRGRKLTIKPKIILVRPDKMTKAQLEAAMALVEADKAERREAKRLAQARWRTKVKAEKEK